MYITINVMDYDGQLNFPDKIAEYELTYNTDVTPQKIYTKKSNGKEL